MQFITAFNFIILEVFMCWKSKHENGQWYMRKQTSMLLLDRKVPSTIALFHDKHSTIAEIIELLILLHCPFIPSHQKHTQCKTMRHYNYVHVWTSLAWRLKPSYVNVSSQRFPEPCFIYSKMFSTQILSCTSLRVNLNCMFLKYP